MGLVQAQDERVDVLGELDRVEHQIRYVAHCGPKASPIAAGR
jgi:hypothetical protein